MTKTERLCALGGATLIVLSVVKIVTIIIAITM